MKHITFIIITSFLIFSGCKEIPPYIDFSVPDETLIDTSYIDNNLPPPQNKIVLIEEFTGINCTYCPGGHQELARLDSSYPDRLNIVSIHAGTFARPQPGLFDIDLRTDAGDALGSMFGGTPAVFPTAVIDRFIFTGDQDLFDDNTGTWETRISERLSENVPVNITVSNVSYDDQTGELQARVGLHYTQNVNVAHYLSVFILEDSLVTPQLDNGTWVPNYVQRHVLRDMLSSYQGDALSESLVTGRVFEKEYKLAIDANWNKDQCHILAVVHHSGDSLNIVQSASGHLVY